jgi:hypothetical protein
VARDDVVDGQVECVFAAVLAGVAIAPEYLAARQLNTLAGPLDHLFQADNGRAGKNGIDRPDFSSTVHHQRSAFSQDQADCPANATYMDGLKICI